LCYLGEGYAKGGENAGDATLTEEQVHSLLPPYIEALKEDVHTIV
jgi:hypothetical protein